MLIFADILGLDRLREKTVSVHERQVRVKMLKKGVICDDQPMARSKNWARLIKKIYEVDPWVCFRCQGSMRVVAFPPYYLRTSIEDEDVIKTILKHLGLWI